ncbi:UNVERIFIED_CONTAM: hypothetical protein K2H54_069355 [Gekko kuhli]
MATAAATSGAGSGGSTAGRNFSFKVVLLGEGCVGKTSLVLRYCENKFNDKHITTLQMGLQNAARLAVVCGGKRALGCLQEPAAKCTAESE